MKITKYSFMLSFVATTVAMAAPGCMDNSYHLTQRNDPKEYHYVECNCPCEKKYTILARHSTCSKCGHYRDPRYNTMLNEHKPLAHSDQYPPFFCALKTFHKNNCCK